MNALIPYRYGEVTFQESAWIDGTLRFTRKEIGIRLGFRPQEADRFVHMIIKRHPQISRFATVNIMMTVEGGRTVERELEVYDLYGFMLIAQFCTKPKAQEFKFALVAMVQALAEGKLRPPEPSRKCQRIGDGKFFSPSRQAKAEALARYDADRAAGYTVERKMAFYKRIGISAQTAIRIRNAVAAGKDPTVLAYGGRTGYHKPEVARLLAELPSMLPMRPARRREKGLWDRETAGRFGVSRGTFYSHLNKFLRGVAA
jgi:hypothetical protein